VSERVSLTERATLSADEIKARRATFGGAAASRSFTTEKCVKCQKSLYPNDRQLRLDGAKYHQACAKCIDCGVQITLSVRTVASDKHVYIQSIDQRSAVARLVELHQGPG
jgi:hypothetical protein